MRRIDVFIIYIFCLIFFIIIAGCSARNELAPVTELKSQAFSRSPNIHIVHRGETLYAIAFGYDIDFRQLAQINNLKPPYRLRVGQVLHIKSGTRQVSRAVPYRSQWTSSYPQGRNQQSIRKTSKPVYPSGAWYWPVKGRIITYFIPNQGKKGINIASKKGEKVRAASSGIVAYAGSGLAGYGNLIIIKHNNEFLTAYGNNSKNLVSEGQRVSTGQIIAEVGVIQHQFWGVHFEIRKRGIPVNPLNYLKKD